VAANALHRNNKIAAYAAVCPGMEASRLLPPDAANGMIAG